MVTQTSTTTDVSDGAILAFLGIFLFVIFLFMIPLVIGMWKTFTKAGRPGWAAIVPFYNIWVLVDIVGRPTWWFAAIVAANLFGSFIPFIGLASLVLLIIIALDMAKSFNKGTGFGVGLAFLPFIFYPILGFGSATYQGPAASGGSATGPASGYVPSNTPAPGWYPDPSGAAAQRYWDGTKWTELTA